MPTWDRLVSCPGGFKDSHLLSTIETSDKYRSNGPHGSKWFSLFSLYDQYACKTIELFYSVPTATSASVKQPSKNSTRSDCAVSSDLITASPSSLHSRQISYQETDKSVSEKTLSISEDIDHSISESINTDVGADFAPDEESTADILSEESKRQESKEGWKLNCQNMLCYSNRQWNRNTVLSSFRPNFYFRSIPW